VVVEGARCALRPVVRDEIYRIGCEALRNAFRHAQATRIEVGLVYDERQLRVRVCDDGKGIDLPGVNYLGRRTTSILAGPVGDESFFSPS